MNLFLAHSETVRAECKTILNTVDNFMSSQDSKPLLVIKQDAMSGGYVLTYGRVGIKKHVFFDCLTGYRKHKSFSLNSYEDDYFDIQKIENKIKHIIKIHKLYNNFDQLRDSLKTNLSLELEKLNKKLNRCTNNTGIATSLLRVTEGNENVPDTEHDSDKSNYEFILSQVNTLKYNIENIEKYTEDYIIFNGHSLFSFLLPDDFQYICQNNLSPDGKPVYVKCGVLLSGTLDKSSIGNSSGSLSHHLAKDYGYQTACNFLSYYQIMINNWLLTHGMTIGLKDCMPKNTEIIEDEMNKSFLEAYSIMKSEKDPYLLEAKIQHKLNEATNVGQKHAKDSLSNDNNFINIIKSGAKGSIFNVTQVTGTVGQQNVNGERISKLYNGRTLPHYAKLGVKNNDPDCVTNVLKDEVEDPIPLLKKIFQSRGFVSNSYIKGLSPEEFFFHAAGGREGLIDTACKTSSTGYVQRKMIKILEDLKYDYNNVVSTSNNSVIQFMYGEDNMDPSQLINTKQGYSFIDIDHTVEKLNSQFELNLLNSV